MRIVEVTWEDAYNPQFTWATKSEVRAASGGATVRSVGMLLMKTKRHLVLCGSYGKGFGAKYGEIVMIPKGMVRKVQRLRR